MLILVLRKMLNNKWMVACLLIGSILAAAVVSCIPLYTNGILQRMLTKDLENSQKASQVYPGNYYFSMNFYSFRDNDCGKTFRTYNGIIEKMYNDIGLPAVARTNNVKADVFLVRDKSDGKKSDKTIAVEALSGFADHIKITYGKMYSAVKQDDMYEAIISDEAMKNLGLVVGNVYDIKDFTGSSDNENEDPSIMHKVKIVGIYAEKDPNDAYWYDSISAYNKSLIIDYSLFSKEYIKAGDTPFSQSKWFYALDYHKITIKNIGTVIDTYERQKQRLKNYGIGDFQAEFIPILEQYHDREKELSMTLWVLEVPIIIVLAFYIFMVSQFIVDHDKNEIAVLKSRGASRWQIFSEFLIEGVGLGALTLLLGPILGLLLSSIMGSSNGFLEFVDRTSQKISLDSSGFLYASGAVILFILTMLIPVFLSSRISIVEFKRTVSRKMQKPLWQKVFLDLILLTATCYGFYRFNEQRKTLIQTGIKGTDLAIDPLLFLTSTFFILGAGLLFLRIFPYIVRFVFWSGKKIWSPVFYASFIQVGRSKGQEQFLMLFIIFTLSIGIFNANAARTINKGVEDKASYSAGADIVIGANWQTVDTSELSQDPAAGAQAASVSTGSTPVQYEEPPFLPYTKLSGVETATKVLRKDIAVVSMPTAKGGKSSVGSVNLLGIIPNEFGKVAWFRNDLLPHHINEYLNLMTEDKTAVLLSSSFEKKYALKVGDGVNITWPGQTSITGTIYAFIDYWPTFNPNEKISTSSNETKDFAVVNLGYIQDKMALEPYEVWLKKSPGATSKQIFDDMEKVCLVNNSKVIDRSSMVIEKKNDPLLQGTNGALTLGFLLTMTIALAGFLIYWILSIKQRSLQFGIFRALGLSGKAVIGILACEQVLISGSAIVMGIVIGKLTSKIFIRLFEIVYSAEQQMLPFRVVENLGDYLRLYTIIGIMLVTCFIALGGIISKIRVNQVIKLGED